MDKLDKIFRAYDVRGVYSDEINEEIAYKIGRAAAKFLKVKEIVIGRDNRLSSDDLFKFLCEGICDEGTDAVNIGVVTTPMFYWAVAKYNYKGGIMITASHNPEEYNGFKIVGEKSISIARDCGLEKIKKIIEESKFKNGKKGTVKKREFLEDYLVYLIKLIDFNISRPLKVFVDYGRSETEKILPSLFKNSLVKLTDDNSEKSDFGVIFDRDGDRIVFLDENGNKINPDAITALLINKFFHKAGKILYPIAASRVIKEEILNNGNKAVSSRVGHAFVKEKMEKEGVVFGAESSGHYYFKDGCILESPLTAMIKVIAVILQENRPISGIIKPFQKYFLERINFDINRFYKTIKEIEQKYKKMGKVSHLDGLTIEYSDWWFNLRPSNTEPLMRLTIEADTRELLEEKKKEIFKSIPS